MKSLDTSVILRFLLNDVSSQTAKARNLISDPPVYVSDVVVTETVFVLERSLGYERAFIAEMLRMFLGLPGVMHNDHFLPEVLDLYERKKSLSFVDCYSAIEAKTFDTNLYTFDKKLLHQGGAHVLTP